MYCRYISISLNLTAVFQCADELGIDWEPVRSCAQSTEGERLLAQMGDLTHALRPKVSFIPTIQVNGDQGAQKNILKNLLLELCRKFEVSS